VRALALPGAAVVVVAAVVSVQLGSGGWDYAPARSASPCSQRQVSSVTMGLEGLTENVVLIGLDSAACRLHESRERLVLTIADPHRRRTVDSNALRAGLLDAVTRLGHEHRLPKVSALVDGAVSLSSLPGLAKVAIRALPDSAVDGLLSTKPLLLKAIADLDLSKLLSRLSDPSRLEPVLRDALLRAAADEIIGQIPSPF
jgi:hypothetical protein